MQTNYIYVDDKPGKFANIYGRKLLFFSTRISYGFNFNINYT